MRNKFLLISGFFLVFIVSPHIASGFKRKATIGWSLAQAACAQAVAYGETKTIQSRLKGKSAFRPKGTERCSKLIRTNCESASCKTFECKVGGKGRAVEADSLRGVAPKGGERVAVVNGSFEYQLLFDVDNTQNLGDLWYKTELQKLTRTSTELLKRIVGEASTNLGLGFNVTVTVPLVVTANANANFKFSFAADISSALFTKTEKNVTIYTASNYSVKSNSSLTLYQLCFNGPGLDARTDVVTSHPLAEHDDPVAFDVTYVLEHFLKDIRVEYRLHSSTIPDDAIEAFDRQQPTDLNAYAGSTTKIYLVPEWTTFIDERVTYVMSVEYDVPNVKYSNLAEGLPKVNPRYLKMIRDVREPHGIVKLKIWRTQDPNSKPSSEGYDFWSADLNAGKGIGYYQYLCWKTKPVPVMT